MDEGLNLRLNLLVDAGEIDESIKEAVTDFIEEIEEDFKVSVDEENGAMLVSHLAMALGRIKRGEEINAMDEEIFKEVREAPIYTKMPKYYSKVEGRLNITIPQSERDYIALHVSTLVQDS